ncbi:MAG: PolC-type DNA polymerase III [Bacilli bacterium]|nr:PolC-type DNA polymerase III [Bacilli bacterium]MDD4607692.1 PolC-type DNA polymerase III [Bacilli bacterium]
MQDKIKILLEKINFDNNDYGYLENAKLDKIVGNKKKTDYYFYITIEKLLPVDIYDKFCNLLKEGFKQFEVVKPIFNIKNIDNNMIMEYYNYLINKYSISSPLLSMFIDNHIEISNDILNIDVGNKAEKMKLKSITDNMLEDFKSIGYKLDDIKIKIDEEKEKETRLEIEKMKVVKIKKEEKPFEIIKGNEIKRKITNISDILYPDDDVTIEAYIFAADFAERPTTNIITLKVTDETDSIHCKMFERNADEYKRYKQAFKVGNWYRIRGNVSNDKYTQELSLFIKEVMSIKKEVQKITDNAEEKRVELHAHTFMSQMDGLIDPKRLVKQAYKWGHRAIAITDHNGVQAFPDVYNTICDINSSLPEGAEPFKAIYGAELTMVDDEVNIIIRPNETNLLDNTYVVFDFETTGFNAGGGDQIIEVGAVKLLNGEIIDKFSELIDPKRLLPNKITELTGITDEMLKGKPSEEEVIKRFIDWFEDYPVVAHNAKFDVSFLEMAYQKYNLGEFQNTVIDTLELSRTLDNNFSRHGLSAIVKRYSVAFDESGHHRGDYDAEATALVFHKMMKKLVDRNIERLCDLDKLVSKDEIHKYGRTYHINVLAKNRAGLKNLFKIISLSNTKYLYKTPRILRSEITNLREGLLIGSGCYESEVFVEARSKSDEELNNIVSFYDYVEVQPLECYDHLLQMDNFGNISELIEHVKKIIRVTEDAGKLVVATGDVHHLTRDDRIYREIIANQKVPGGGRHPLARNNITQIPSNHFRTTEEMLNDFSFLDEEVAKRIVVTNPNKIADMFEIIEVIIETGGIPFSPKIENSVETVNELVYGKAHELYGDPLPELIEERIKQELDGIIKGGFDVIYLISQKLVKKSNDDGYLVGSRGSVGSSFVATMMGITEVNPLPAHYVCPSCRHSIFEIDGQTLGSKYSSGYDLPDMECPKCGTQMKKEGQDMPFATFLGFDADKVPDIDLNFSGEYQWKAHEYTKELFGIDNVYRAGTIGTVADKTAYGYVKGYCEDKNITMRSAEVERLALGCTGVKRTTGQHPGGIVVIPEYMDVFDFTPFQFPADDPKSLWRTTHFDYHAIDQNVLKLDILGHDDPTILRMLQDLSGIDVTKINMSDPDVMQIFSSPEVLGVTKEQIMCETGTLGIPEFGTKFVIGMLTETRPKTFSELLKISGLSHGTDVWLGNAQELIRNKTCEFKEVIGCRDDIMVYLMYNGMQPKKAFKIMEFVRKGKATKDPEGWKVFEAEMREAGIVDWYIKSCQKIKYMFPKAHAAAYIMSALRIAWFKVHHPIWYYSAYFSVRCTDFDIEAMIKGYDAIKARIIEIVNKGYEATNKENAVLEVLEIALEATARGFKFANIDLEKSDATNFIIADDHTLIPPFRTIDGLGGTVANKIVEEREKGRFLSIEDLQKRGKVSGTLIEKMRSMGVLDGMDETSQLSLF